MSVKTEKIQERSKRREERTEHGRREEVEKGNRKGWYIVDAGRKRAGAEVLNCIKAQKPNGKLRSVYHWVRPA